MARPLPERRLSEVDRLHLLIERIYELVPLASDEGRPTRHSDTLLDGYAELGRIFTRMGRG